MTQHIFISNSSTAQGRVLQYMLNSKGYEVTLKYNFGIGFLHFLDEHHTDLVILDKHSPESCPKQMCEQCWQHCLDILS